jgi:hypothetical protein
MLEPFNNESGVGAQDRQALFFESGRCYEQSAPNPASEMLPLCDIDMVAWDNI